MKLLNNFPLVIEARIQCSLCFFLDSLFFEKYFASFTGRGELVLLGIPLPCPELLPPCADYLWVQGEASDGESNEGNDGSQSMVTQFGLLNFFFFN